MEWRDEAIILAARRLGEAGMVASVLTREHGRYCAMVPGGAAKANRAIMQVGNLVQATWKARLIEQLGTYRLELLQAHAARAMEHSDPLLALSAACALCELVLPERQPHAPVFAALNALLTALPSQAWPSVYVHWELALLRDLGFGLDLGSCAVTGATEDLIYVSPKSARAVSAEAGAPYRHKLLALPQFLRHNREGEGAEIAAGLALTGYFLERHVLHHRHSPMPSARVRLVDRFRS